MCTRCLSSNETSVWFVNSSAVTRTCGPIAERIVMAIDGSRYESAAELWWAVVSVTRTNLHRGKCDLVGLTAMHSKPAG
jgi:hypothetical protein